MTGLNSLRWQIHDHLKEHRPKFFQELKAKNQLLPFVKNLENQANNQLDELEDNGLQPHEAMEVLRDQIFPPSEEDAPNLGRNIKPYRD